LEHRYDLTSGGSWGSDHPIHTVNWFDVVKWCNARSEKEGLVPAYYLDEAKTQVYRSGDKVPTVNWNAGYRLPTEAEWEKAARGGVEGKLYPWADSEEISDDRLNYNNKFGRTTPVGSYPANGYGLRDMAGNVWEWVWDWHAEYPGGLVTDPRGPESGSARLLRGGGWVGAAEDCRAADRLPHPPTRRNYHIGFRAVLPVGQP
jgi:formylglycine-generating enzyme required for sulfatase activity